MTFRHTFQVPSGEQKAAELLKPDWYNFEVIDCFTTDRDGNDFVTKAGDPYIKVRALQPSSGIILYHTLFFSEQGHGKVNAFLHATGAQAEDGEELEISPSHFVGKSFRGKVEITERNGRKYNQIARVRKPEATQEVEPESQEEKPALDPDLNEDVPF